MPGLERPSLTTERGCIQHGWRMTDRVCLYVNADEILVEGLGLEWSGPPGVIAMSALADTTLSF